MHVRRKGNRTGEVGKNEQKPHDTKALLADTNTTTTTTTTIVFTTLTGIHFIDNFSQPAQLPWPRPCVLSDRHRDPPTRRA